MDYARKRVQIPRQKGKRVFGGIRTNMDFIMLMLQVEESQLGRGMMCS